MFGGKKIKVSDELYQELVSAAEIVGCASVEEYVERVLRVDVDRVLSEAGKKELSEAEVDDIANKMRGLGYIE